MREDMHRKLIERGRWGSRWLKSADVKARRQELSRARASGDFDALDTRAPMRTRRGNRRSPSETFGPLLAFLRARVGRPWDKVYSEIRQNIDPASVIDMHIMQHLFEFVRRDVWIDDQKRVWHRYWGHPVQLYRTKHSFYVHPKTGLLCRPTQVRLRRSKPVKRARHIVLEDGGLGLPLKGGWFRVTLLRLPGEHYPSYKDSPFDVVLKEVAGHRNVRQREALYGAVFYVGVYKQQIGRRELRLAGVR